MTFPVDFNLLGRRFTSHLAMELLAYTAGSQLYFFLRRRWGRISGTPLPPLPLEANLWLIVGCVFGALFGSKALAWVESFHAYWPHRDTLAGWVGGKTIVGGLLGGWAGVEVAKKILGVRHSTGDVFVFPLIVGMALGRVGCFLTGLEDHTYGHHTRLPWGVDFGDGPRHPTQLYDIAFLLLLGLALLWRMRRPYPNGRLFRLFMLGYLGWRFAVEFLKPRETYLGISPIQMACGAGCLWCASSLFRGGGAAVAGHPHSGTDLPAAATDPASGALNYSVPPPP